MMFPSQKSAAVAFSLAWVAALAVPVHAATPESKTMGFAVTSYPFAIYKGADDCPDGMAMAAKEIYLLSVPPAERERLTKPENLKEFEQHAYYTPEGKDLCTVLDYPRAPQRTTHGHVSYGMNLDGTADGAATPTTCAHEKFTSPDGVTGVDNQTTRVFGCSSNYRGPVGEMGYLNSLRNSGLKDGGTTILIELIGVTDTRNDDNIQVGIYNGADPMALDATGHMLPYASLSVTEDKTYQVVAHARIKDGIVTTDPVDLKIHYDVGGGKKVYHMRGGRLRLELTPDGKAKGMLAGYITIEDVDVTANKKQSGSEMIGIDCPTFSQAIRRYADGYPDPVTGKCTALSTAFEIEAIPAFIFHPAEERKTAEATGATQNR